MYNADEVATDFYNRPSNFIIMDILLADENRNIIVTPYVAINQTLKKLGFFETIYLRNCLSIEDMKWLK